MEEPEIYQWPMDRKTRLQIERDEKHRARRTCLLGLVVWILTMLVMVGIFLALAGQTH